MSTAARPSDNTRQISCISGACFPRATRAFAYRRRFIDEREPTAELRQDALQLVAANRWLVRYLSEGTPSLRNVARVKASLDSRAAHKDERPA